MEWPIIVQEREVDEEKMRWLSGWIAEHAQWSRRKLAGELCGLWDRRDGSGRSLGVAGDMPDLDKHFVRDSRDSRVAVAFAGN